MATSENIAVTGATGQLGRLVVAGLLRIAPAAHVIGIVRNTGAAGDLAERGAELRKADYDDPAALAAALAGVDKVLLISSNEVGRRVPQHRNVIDAAKTAGVKLLAYTSILHADTNPMELVTEHRETEVVIRSSGVPFALLRNGWYTENYTGVLGMVVQLGTVFGAARDGRISSAARADFAAAAAAVLADDAQRHVGKVYELAGDDAYTLTEYAAEIARQTGKPMVYSDMPEADYRAMLQNLGVPAAFAAVFADSDARAAEGALYEAGRDLSRLIGRPTTSLADSIRTALAAL